VAQHLGDEPPRPSTCSAISEAAARATGTTVAQLGDSRALRVTEVHDEVLLRALRKAPSERWASAGQMADAIRGRWPADDCGISLPRAPSSRAQPQPAKEARSIADEPGPDLPLGRSRMGLLFRRQDPALGRPVMIEIHDRPLADADLERLQALAAAGGPNIQRVLALSDDGRTVTYELVEGPRVSPIELSRKDAALVTTANALIDAAKDVPPPDVPTTVIMTTGGPVLLVVEARTVESEPDGRQENFTQ
jgi:hypothetical protein